MRKRFFEEFDIVRMTRSSIVVRERRTGLDGFMHRNAFNELDHAEDFRFKERIIDGRSSWWVEILIWKAI